MTIFISVTRIFGLIVMMSSIVNRLRLWKK